MRARLNSKLTLVFLVLALLVFMMSPAAAVTHGELDGEDHPHVVLVLIEVDVDGVSTPMFRCSGTLIAPTFVLTAGHCTNGHPDFTFTHVRIFTESAVDGGDNNYPLAGPNSVEGTRFESHPLYETAPFFVHDAGMIELADPVELDEYGTLPGVDSLDALKPRSSTKFTAVGYGLQRVNPAQVTGVRVRMVAEPHLIQINTGFTGDFSLLLSNNAATGGTCFGDSGGPNFLGDSNVVAGVTSFGLNGTCGGTGGVFRVDRQNVLDFINDFMAA